MDPVDNSNNAEAKARPEAVPEEKADLDARETKADAKQRVAPEQPALIEDDPGGAKAKAATKPSPEAKDAEEKVMSVENKMFKQKHANKATPQVAGKNSPKSVSSTPSMKNKENRLGPHAKVGASFSTRTSRLMKGMDVESAGGAAFNMVLLLAQMLEALVRATNFVKNKVKNKIAKPKPDPGVEGNVAKDTGPKAGVGVELKAKPKPEPSAKKSLSDAKIYSKAKAAKKSQAKKKQEAKRAAQIMVEMAPTKPGPEAKATPGAAAAKDDGALPESLAQSLVDALSTPPPRMTAEGAALSDTDMRADGQAMREDGGQDGPGVTADEQARHDALSANTVNQNAAAITGDGIDQQRMQVQQANTGNDAVMTSAQTGPEASTSDTQQHSNALEARAQSRQIATDFANPTTPRAIARKRESIARVQQEQQNGLGNRPRSLTI